MVRSVLSCPRSRPQIWISATSGLGSFDPQTMLLLLALLSLRLAGALLSPPPLSAPPPPDLILSSGFLAFARQAGVIEALQDKGVALGRIVGTSSGALAGSMLAAGYSGEAIGKELSRRRPIQLFSLGRRMHRGLFSLSGLQAHMSTLLPKDFKDLKYPLAVGTYATSTGRFELVTDGDLCAAVAASCAIPYIFQPVMAGSPPVYRGDGGAKDRTGLEAWAAWDNSANSYVTPNSATSGAVGGYGLGQGMGQTLGMGIGEGEGVGMGQGMGMGVGMGAANPRRRAIVHLVQTFREKGGPQSPQSQSPLPCPQSQSQPPLSLTSDPSLQAVQGGADCDLFIVRTKRARAGFLSLRDFNAQQQEAYGCAAKAMASPEFQKFIR